MRESKVLKRQASTQTATYTDDDNTYADNYNMPETYREDYYFEQDWPPGYDEVHQPESLWQPYYLAGHEKELDTVHELQVGW